ncbi:MAG: hypothetical protein ACOYK9_05550 [Chlamydiia bacterium]
MKFAWFLLAITPLFAQVKIYLNDLKVVNGRFSTDQGGLFFSDQIQLQAQNIHYDQEKKTLEASDNLLFFLNGQVFVASRLYIDLESRTGWFEDLTTKIKTFYFSANQVGLDEKNCLNFDRLEITPFEAPPIYFSFQVQKGSIDENRHLQTKAISAQLLGVPVFYLPELKWDLSELPSSAIRYRVQYNTEQYPVVSFRYPIVSDVENQALLRFDYRIGKGFAAAIESKSKANQDRLHLKTKNYVAYDTFYNDNNIQNLYLRYRFLGKFDSFPKNPDLVAKFQYDLNSDRDLRQNFNVEQFEMHDVMRTEGVFAWNPSFGQNALYFRPRANNYQSLNQQLPSLQIRLEPIEWKPVGLYFNNNFECSYFDYNFSKNLDGVVKPFSSARLQTTQQLDLPLQMGPLKIEPDGLFSAIYYSQTPLNNSNLLVYFNYGITASTLIEGCMPSYTHTIQPYIDYHAFSRPNLKQSDRFIFSLSDGIFQIQQLKTGLLNTLHIPALKSSCRWDLYGLNFFSQETFTVLFPKLKSFLSVDTPYCNFKNGFGYNFQTNSIDFLTFEWGWTFKKTFAFHLDWLYRGPYEWKKDDRDNYQLDMAYPIDTLVVTPLSDKRATLISRLEWHFIPNWTLRFQHHNGFWRADQPPYFECQAEIGTIFRSAFDIRLSFMRSVNDTQVQFSLNLL